MPPADPNRSAMMLRRRLKSIGLSDSTLAAAWPTWWSDAAEASPSAFAELQFSIARKLGLDPRSLLDEVEVPRFVWKDEARYKHLASENEQELSAITSFGTALAGALVSATPSQQDHPFVTAKTLREMLLRTRQYIRLADLLSVSWSFSIPAIHLRIFPSERKRMAAMAVTINDRNAILLGKDSLYPAHIAFYLAHELAHIFLGHLKNTRAIVDMDSDIATPKGDDEESEADSFALELLTGQSRPIILSKAKRPSSAELARTALEAANELKIEPGTIALCFGYSTGNWALATAAMASIYTEHKPVWNEINRVAMQQLDFDLVSDDTKSYLSAVLGSVEVR